ncbi:uncharacterized protein LOC132451444 isoform X1 [Gadus macrocephalus]|uniref:uncharacterized protein LOC132451444 isoform X1 n=1 Tax=Gadus macrocephalus TaxID=80720 RepID=UPI0028CB5984|nr:uncharacterized protein LOC132451444 isoform X1 [Gadus macrocephalus]
MAAVFAVLLLGLLAAAADVPAAPSCDDVITPLRRDQADKTLGSWVLVGVVTDRKMGLPLPASSFMELSLSEDNSSFTYMEWNGLGNEPCNRFRIMGNITDDANLTLRLHTMDLGLGGVETTPQEVFGQITLFQSCPSCPEDRLTSYYRGVDNPTDSNSPAVQFIMNYRREGKHQDLEALKEVPLSTRQQAACLNMTEITGEDSYDGVSEPCPRKVLVLKPDE